MPTDEKVGGNESQKQSIDGDDGFGRSPGDGGDDVSTDEAAKWHPTSKGHEINTHHTTS